MTPLKQNSPSTWKMFSTTLSGSKGVPPADSKSSVAIFGAIDNTMHFRIEARNFRNVTGVCLNVGDGNIVADLLKFFTGLMYLQSQGIININWDKLQDKLHSVSESTVTTIANSLTDAGQISPIAGNLGIPLTGGLAAGFALGITKG